MRRGKKKVCNMKAFSKEKCLVFTDYTIGNKGASMISEAMKQNNSLVELNLASKRNEGEKS